MAITLKKSGETHKLTLAKNQTVSIHVNLKWNPREKKGGGFLGLGNLLGGGGTEAADLDLGCMYEMANGNKGVVQALGNLFGSKDGEPFILLDKDDRSGNSADGENLDVFRSDQISRVLLFAYIYDRSTDFRSVAARVTLKASNGEELVIELDNPTSSRTFCALATITNVNGQVSVKKEEAYFDGHRDCDAAYGFGFNWVNGSK